MNPTSLGSLIQQRRKKLGLTQEDLAALSGCSVTLVYEVERGKPSVSFERLLEICRTVGIQLRAELGSAGLVIDESF